MEASDACGGAPSAAAQLEHMSVSPAEGDACGDCESKRLRVCEADNEPADADAPPADAPDEFANSDAWACGANANGALGTGDTAAALRPKRVRARRAWCQLALGDSHGAGITATGQLLTWGLNDRGQTGHGPDAERERPSPARVEALEDRACVCVALGFEHSAAVTAEGVFCFGSNEFGQCGAGDGGPVVVATPRLARTPRGHAVTLVACGAQHTLALTAAGAVLAWGQGGAGQLGTGDVEDRRTPTLLTALWGVPCVALAAGEAHSLALTRLGSAFAWGRAASGALGLTEREGDGDCEAPDTPRAPRPAPIAVVTALVDMGIERALAEEAAAAAPGVESAVEYAFAHQRRSSDRSRQSTPLPAVGMTRGAALLPRRVTAAVGAPNGTTSLPRLSAIAAGAMHSVFVAACGDVYTCGAGASGALGHGGSGTEALPRRVTRTAERRVVAAAAGAAHTLLLCADGAVMACGAGEDGALGMDDARDKAVPLPLPPWPGAPPDARVVAIAAGGYASALIARPGSLPPPPPTLACPAAALEAALAAAESGDGDGAAAHARVIKAVCAAVDAALGSALGAAAFTLPPSEQPAPPGAPAPLIDAARVEALAVRALLLARAAPEVLSALRAAQERLVEELGSHADEMLHREHAAALAVAAASPLLSGAASGAPLLRALCPLLPHAPRKVRVLLRAGWAATPAALLASRAVRPLQAFIAAEVTSTRATTPCVVAAIAALAMAHAANAAPGRPAAEVLPAEEFYNATISDNFNTAEDFALWVEGGASFTFCAHPFLLTAGAKARLLRLEAAMRMHASVEASRAAAAAAAFRLPQGAPRWLRFLAGEVGAPFGEDPPPQATHQAPPPPLRRSGPLPAACELPAPGACGMPATHPEACVLRVRRERLVEDTLAEVARQAPDDLFKPLKVHFIGEDGIDAGGLRKEFFQLLLFQLMSPEHGLFTQASDGRARWLAPDKAAGGRADTEQQAVWRLVGSLLGLAIYNGVILELHLPRAFFCKLLGAPVGLDELEAFEPQVGKSLRALLAWSGPGSVEDTFCLSFVHEGPGADGTRVVTPLETGGESQPVTEANRERYAAAYAAHVLTRSCARAFDALRAGFLALCGGRALLLVSPAELETLVCGTPHLDFKALEAAARYAGGWDATHPTVRAFWSVVHTQLDLAEQKALLRFVTGSDRAPIGGLGALSVLVTREGPDSQRLPTASTCFNALRLPEYGSRGKLANQLRIAITNAAEGFGLM
jgi:alpha-tubulin suppressor-like RCC1 family protein